jgi:hypothetical protein
MKKHVIAIPDAFRGEAIFSWSAKRLLPAHGAVAMTYAMGTVRKSGISFRYEHESTQQNVQRARLQFKNKPVK